MLKRMILFAFAAVLLAACSSTPENAMVFATSDTKGAKLSVQPQTGNVEAMFGFSGNAFAWVPTETKRPNVNGESNIISGIRETGCTFLNLGTPDPRKTCESYSQDVLTAAGFFGGDTSGDDGGLSETIGRAYCVGLVCHDLFDNLAEILKAAHGGD